MTFVTRPYYPGRFAVPDPVLHCVFPYLSHYMFLSDGTWFR